MKRYILLPVSGIPSVLEVAQDELATLQKAVGGLIAPVDLPNGYTIYVNDEGLLDGLPFNLIASQLAGQYLAGNAVMVGTVDPKGETGSVGEDWVATIEQVQQE